MATISYRVLAWNDLVKPAGQALLFGGVTFCLGWTVTGVPDGGAMWGITGAAAVLVKRFFIDDTIETVKRPKAEPAPVKELRPWEVTTKSAVTDITVRHANQTGEGPVWWYHVPLEQRRLSQAAFHLVYLGGRFSDNYMNRQAGIMTGLDFKNVERYLVDNYAARWRNSSSKKGGVELLEDGIAMFDWFARLYNPLPHERKAIAACVRSGVRRYDRQRQITRIVKPGYAARNDIDAQFEANKGEYEQGSTRVTQ